MVLFLSSNNTCTSCRRLRTTDVKPVKMEVPSQAPHYRRNTQAQLTLRIIPQAPLYSTHQVHLSIVGRRLKHHPLRNTGKLKKERWEVELEVRDGDRKLHQRSVLKKLTKTIFLKYLTSTNKRSDITLGQTNGCCCIEQGVPRGLG